MEQVKKQIVTRIIAIMLLFTVSFVFSSCTKIEDKDDESVEILTEEENDISENVKKDITVRFCVHKYVEEFEKLGELFAEKNPGIKLEIIYVDYNEYELVKVQKLLAGEVDVSVNFQTNPLNEEWAVGARKSQLQQEIEMGFYADLTDMPFIKNWDQTALLHSATVNERVFAIPLNMSGLNTVFYNKKIFRENGLSVPETWKEFVNICKILKNKGIDPLIVGGKTGWPLYMMNNGFVAASERDLPAFAKQLWTGERKYNDENSKKIWQKGLDFLTYLGDDYAGTDYEKASEIFADGGAAMLPDGSWQVNTIKSINPDVEFGCFTMPGDTKGIDPVQLSVKYDVLISVNQNSQNKEAALKWLEFLSDRDIYKKFIEMTDLVPTMDISIESDLLSMLEPYLKKPTVCWEQVMPIHPDVNVATFVAFAQYNKGEGTFTSVENISDAAQFEWEKILRASNSKAN